MSLRLRPLVRAPAQCFTLLLPLVVRLYRQKFAWLTVDGDDYVLMWIPRRQRLVIGRSCCPPGQLPLPPLFLILPPLQTPARLLQTFAAALRAGLGRASPSGYPLHCQPTLLVGMPAVGVVVVRM